MNHKNITIIKIGMAIQIKLFIETKENTRFHRITALIMTVEGEVLGTTEF